TSALSPLSSCVTPRPPARSSSLPLPAAFPTCVEPDRVLHVHGDLLIGQVLAQDARAAARAQHYRFLRLRRNDAAQDAARAAARRSEEHTSELQSLTNLACRLLLEHKKRAARQL